MKLATFEVQTVLGPFTRIGLVLEGPGGPVAVDLNNAYAWLLDKEGDPEHARQWADFLCPPSMRIFLELGEPAMIAARRLEMAFQAVLEHHANDLPKGLRGEQLVFPLSEVRLKTPVPDPHMLRDFLAFEVHVANGAKRRNEPIAEAWYKMPVYYKGNPTTLIGHEEPVFWPHYTRRFDYELEMACIIGKKGRNIPVDKAHEYIAGFAIMNDFSARDIQKGEMMCRLGPAKAKDFATAVGPYLVTPDEVGDARNLKMTARINGELWSEGNTGTCHWTWEQMIAHISMEEDLLPGDVLGSGTVGFGSGFELERWPQPGDVMELEIEKLGILRNRVVLSPDMAENAPAASLSKS